MKRLFRKRGKSRKQLELENAGLRGDILLARRDQESLEQEVERLSGLVTALRRENEELKVMLKAGPGYLR